MLRIGISSYCYGYMHVAQALKKNSGLGIKNVELVSFYHLPFNPIEEPRVKLVKNALQINGLRAYSYYSTGIDQKIYQQPRMHASLLNR